MDFIKEILARTDLRSIRNFILNGSDELITEQQSYRDRLENGCNPIYARLDNVYPDRIEHDRAAADLSEALTTYENVYTEIGMKAGARIIHQLLLAWDYLPAEKE